MKHMHNEFIILDSNELLCVDFMSPVLNNII